MNVYDQAHGLARAIEQSEEYKRYRDLKGQIDANPDLSAMVDDFETKQTELQMKQLSGELDPQTAQQQAAEMLSIVSRDPLVAQYIEALMRYSLMIADVYKIISEPMGLGNMPEM